MTRTSGTNHIAQMLSAKWNRSDMARVYRLDDELRAEGQRIAEQTIAAIQAGRLDEVPALQAKATEIHERRQALVPALEGRVNPAEVL